LTELLTKYNVCAKHIDNLHTLEEKGDGNEQTLRKREKNKDKHKNIDKQQKTWQKVQTQLNLRKIRI
jgi:uncharacterized lipoprotein YddW (UPF0748 family)